MKKLKRIISLVLTLAISMSTLGSVTVWADHTEDSAQEISASYNAEITNGILKNAPEATVLTADASEPQTITVHLEKDEHGVYTATGEVAIASGLYDYSVSGDLMEVETSIGDGVVGYMSGALTDGTHLGLNLHYIPTAQKIFVYASVGYVTTESDCETYIFGDVFDEMNTLVGAYAEMANETYGTDEQPVSAEIADIDPLAAADYNVTYRGIGVGRGELINGDLVDLIATTIYTPRRMGPNKHYKGYVKVNGHTGNAKIYIQGTKLIPGTLSAWVTGGTCSISSPNDDMMEMKDMDPVDNSQNIEIPVPYYVGGKWGMLPWNLSLGIYTIKASLSKNSGSWNNNAAKWEHNYSENVNWGDNGAAATERGYAGCCTITYHYNEDFATTTSVTGSGSLNYSYRSVYGATSYTGNFSAYSSIPISIGIDAWQ